MVPLLAGINLKKAELEELYGFLMNLGELKKENGGWRDNTGGFGGNYQRWFWRGIKSVITQRYISEKHIRQFGPTSQYKNSLF